MVFFALSHFRYPLISLNAQSRFLYRLSLTIQVSAVFMALAHSGFFCRRVLMVAHCPRALSCVTLSVGQTRTLFPDLPLLCRAAWDHFRWHRCGSYVASGSKPLGAQCCVATSSERLFRPLNFFCPTQSQGPLPSPCPQWGRFFFFVHSLGLSLFRGFPAFLGFWSDLPRYPGPKFCSFL